MTTLQEDIKACAYYANGTLVRIDGNPDKIEDHIKIFIYNKEFRYLIPNSNKDPIVARAIWVFHHGDFESSDFHIVYKDGDVVNTNIENLELISNRSKVKVQETTYLPVEPVKEDNLKRFNRRHNPTRAEFLSNKDYYNFYFYISPNNYLIWKHHPNGKGKDNTTAGTRLQDSENFPYVTLLSEDLPYAKVLYEMQRGDVPSGYHVVNVDGDYCNLSYHNLRLAMVSNKAYHKLSEKSRLKRLL